MQMTRVFLLFNVESGGGSLVHNSNPTRFPWGYLTLLIQGGAPDPGKKFEWHGGPYIFGRKSIGNWPGWKKTPYLQGVISALKLF